MNGPARWRLAVGLCLLGLGLCVWGAARADGILDVSEDSAAPFDSTTYPVFFPNWTQAPASSYLVYEADDTTCAASSFKGLTIVNYGTATGGPGQDITGVSWKYACAAGATAVTPLTFAGVWTVGGSPRPVWTWGGTIAIPNDPCTACFCFGSLQLYADIGPCPAATNPTVALGPGFDTVSGIGGFSDSCVTNAPSALPSPTPRPIRYVYKTSSPDVAAPGDTVTYTVFYGKPGSANLNNIWIFDTLPSYTHYVPGSGAPQAPDPGWDPDSGPPQRLQWTIANPGAPGLGQTSALTFQATIDWGNGESFEPGSGDLAAPEGFPLTNQAHMSWDPTGCAPGRVSNAVATTVRRFLFYVLGDNDVLFASKLGSPDDEMIYTAFIKNVSSSKTWWSVSMWDTIPAQLDTWANGFGFDDPCLGWTMTPSGCAAASPGVVTTGGNTILTWNLDMPPGTTLEVRWKAKVKGSIAPPATAISIVSLMELGRSRVLNGTGHQGTPKNFVHLASILLRTTYLSYVSVSTNNTLGNEGLFTTFYPLNKATTFELRGIVYTGASFGSYATAGIGGGVSQSIGCLIGDCIGGFPGAGVCTLGDGAAILGGGWPGCRTERIPAMYTAYSANLTAGGYGDCTLSTCGTDPVQPFHILYKLVSNSPVLWQVLSGACNSDQDQFTYDPTTSLSYSGFTVYSFLRASQDRYYDLLNLVNTSVGPTDVLDPTLATTIHIFTWDYGTNTWNWQTSYEVGEEGQVEPYGTRQYACNSHVRVVSSQTKLVSHHGWCALYGPDANNLSHMSPARNSGMLISGTAGEAFYFFAGPWDGAFGGARGLISNIGAGPATVRFERYLPKNPVAVPLNQNCAGIPLWLSDTRGDWIFVVDDTIPAGFYPGNFNAPNPRVYGGGGVNFDLNFLDAPGNSRGLWRATLLSGGPIQAGSGGAMFAVWSGGSVLHPYVPLGQKVGTSYWLGEPFEPTGVGCNAGPSIDTIAVFCPKAGMIARMETNTGVDTRYTTNGSDQCVAFMGLTAVPAGQRRNIRITVTGGDAMVNYNHCIKNHKIFTAPFMEKGEHYDIIAPPVVYIGQSFWITIVVILAGSGGPGQTDTNYTGITSFTSTDRGAKVEATPMDAYNYQWTLANAGVKLFVKVTMTVLGIQTLVATDTLDGSITGITAIQVVGADIKLTKMPPIQVAASGDIVQFKICWSNYSTATGASFTITDEVPNGTVYYPDTPSNHYCGATKGFGAATVAYSTAATPTGFATLTGPATTAVQFLRWTIPTAGVATTGCVCFKVTVN